MHNITFQSKLSFFLAKIMYFVPPPFGGVADHVGLGALVPCPQGCHPGCLSNLHHIYFVPRTCMTPQSDIPDTITAMENGHPDPPQEEPQATILKIPATARDLPDESMQEMNFLDSSFFAKDPSRDLPTPAQVRALATGKYRGVRPLGVIFDESKIFVKYGREATIREAQCLWFIKRTFGDEVPVPEVYGWRVDGEQVFIYMEYIQGQTLHDAWNELDSEDKSSLLGDLCRIVNCLRQLEQDTSDQFIGMLLEIKDGLIGS